MNHPFNKWIDVQQILFLIWPIHCAASFETAARTHTHNATDDWLQRKLLDLCDNQSSKQF